MSNTEKGRFFMVPQSIIETDQLNKNEKLIYMVLCRYADNNTRECWPSISTISKKSGISRKSVIKIISNLEQKGAINKNTRFQGDTKERASNKYKLGSVPITPRSVTTTPQVVSPLHQGGVTTTPELDLENYTNKNYTTGTPSEPPALSTLPAYIKYWKQQSKKKGKISYPEEFERWCTAYPRIESKKKTFKLWIGLIENGVDAEELQRAAENYARSTIDTEQQFKKHSTTFLGSGEPYQDYLESASSEQLEESKPSFDVRSLAGYES